MTTEQKNRIVSLRKEGYGYAAVAKKLGLTKNAVSYFCRQNGLAGAQEKKDLQTVRKLKKNLVSQSQIW